MLMGLVAKNAILLLDAAMLLAFAPPALGDVRRAGAALPLLALVVVPATLVHPGLPYAQGLLLFDAQLYEPHAVQWWADLARMDRAEFEKLAAELVRSQGTLVMLRAVAAASAGTA